MDCRVNRIFLILSFVMFLATTTLCLTLTYDAYLTSKDGEFCHYRQQLETNYDFEFPEGYKCDFLISGLLEPTIVTVLFNIISQTPIWLLYGIYKFIKI